MRRVKRPWFPPFRTMAFGVGSWLAMLGIAFGALLLADCGGSKPQTVTICSGLTDRCQTAPLSRLRAASDHSARFASAGCHVPDVSDYQGYVDWAKAKPYVCGGISKMGEGSGYAGGGQFVHNWTQMRALGIWHAGYWFLRGSAGCDIQANGIIARLQSVGYATDPLAGNVQLDAEVPGSNAGDEIVCISNRIWQAFHRGTDVYTSPGTNPGGSHGSDALWQAEYGPSLHPVWQPVVAWQCTDGVYGCVSFVGGIGYGDVSIDLGITRERGGPVVPPGPTQAQLAHWRHARDASLHAYRHTCKQPVLTTGRCDQFGWRVIHFQRLLDRPSGPVCFGRHAQRNAAVCVIVRAEVAVYTRAAAATSRALGRIGACQAATQPPRPPRICGVLSHREQHFNARIQAILTEF